MPFENSFDHGPIARDILTDGPIQNIAYYLNQIGFIPTTGQQFNVQTYGATGNGTTDDTAAVQSAVNAAQAVGGVVLVPTGTYLVSKTITPGALGTFSIQGNGPEHSIIAPAASFTGTWVIDLNFSVSAPNVNVLDIEIDMTANKTLNGLRIGNSTSGKQTDRSRVVNFKTRYGAVPLAFDGGSIAFMARDIYCTNSTAGIHITNSNATGSPNGAMDNVLLVNTDNAVVTTQGMLIDTYMTGLALNNVRVIGTASAVYQAGIKVNVSTPTGTNGEFIQATNCITDAITGPGLWLINCRQFQSTNNFWSSLLNTANYGVVIDGGNYFRFVNDEISGCGVQYLHACDDIAFTACEFPATGSVAGVHFMPAATPPTNIQLDLQTLNYSANTTGLQLTNDLAKFYTALTDPASLRFTDVRLSSPTVGPVIESFPFRLIGVSSTSMTIGSIFMERIWIPRGVPVSTIYWACGTSATLGTTTHYWVALYAQASGLASGSPLVQSTDNTNPTITGGVIQAVATASTYVIPSSGYYFVAVMFSSVTGSPVAPTYANFAGLSAFTGMIPKLCYIQQTGFASGTAPSVSGSASNLGNEMWVGVG